MVRVDIVAWGEVMSIKIYCEPCKATGEINVKTGYDESGEWGREYVISSDTCPTCHGDGYTLQGCKNCKHQDGGIGGTISALKDEIIETDATQYHCAHHEQYLPAGITCEEWRVKE